MQKIDLIGLGNSQRVSPSTKVPITFKINFFTGVPASSKIIIRVSSESNFLISEDITPTELFIKVGEAWESRAGNTLNSSDIGQLFKVEYDSSAENEVKYVRIILTEDTIEYSSYAILLTSENTLDFKTKPISVGDIMPTKIKVTDRKNIIDSPNVSITVQACNNAFDDNPTWENITSQYNDGSFFKFTNMSKIAPDWGIAVRYLVTKAVYTAGFELNEVYIAHI